MCSHERVPSSPTSSFWSFISKEEKLGGKRRKISWIPKVQTSHTHIWTDSYINRVQIYTVCTHMLATHVGLVLVSRAQCVRLTKHHSRARYIMAQHEDIIKTLPGRPGPPPVPPPPPPPSTPVCTLASSLPAKHPGRDALQLPTSHYSRFSVAGGFLLTFN